MLLCDHGWTHRRRSLRCTYHRFLSPKVGLHVIWYVHIFLSFLDMIYHCLFWYNSRFNLRETFILNCIAIVTAENTAAKDDTEYYDQVSWRSFRRMLGVFVVSIALVIKVITVAVEVLLLVHFWVITVCIVIIGPEVHIQWVKGPVVRIIQIYVGFSWYSLGFSISIFIRFHCFWRIAGSRLAVGTGSFSSWGGWGLTTTSSATAASPSSTSAEMPFQLLVWNVFLVSKWYNLCDEHRRIKTFIIWDAGGFNIFKFLKGSTVGSCGIFDRESLIGCCWCSQLYEYK